MCLMSLSFSHSSKTSMTISRVASSELAFLCNNGRSTSRKRGKGNSMEWNGMAMVL
jgi:hypothetical protein